jgi:hypothetical protein
MLTRTMLRTASGRDGEGTPHALLRRVHAPVIIILPVRTILFIRVDQLPFRMQLR